MISPGTTVAAALRMAAARLTAAGIEDARLDARLLLEIATDLAHEQLLLAPDRSLGATDAARLAGLIHRRVAREPVSRIAGERWFYGRRFLVSTDTLDPRPETETLVELALDIAAHEPWGAAPARILDIGTGTGCIVLTLLAELPMARGLGVDVSRPAIEVARRNAERHEVLDRCDFRVIELPDDAAGRFDLVVANPPYIPTPDIAGLAPEVRNHDPLLALDGGPDGLTVIAATVAWSARQPGVWFAIEHGAGQSAAVRDLIELHCGPTVAGAARIVRDLGGHDRCVAWKPLS